MTHQPGILKSQLYHQQLARMLKPVAGVHLRVRIAHGFELSYRERLNELLNRNSLDGVMLHVRVTFVRKASLFTYYSSGGSTRFVVHPFLFRRRALGGWARMESMNFDDTPVVATRDKPDAGSFKAQSLGYRIARDASHVAGMLFGLGHWAIEDELFEIAQFNQACVEKQVPCFVLGPTPHGDSAVRNALCRKINHVLKERLAKMNVPFCSLEGMIAQGGVHMQHYDGVHLTAEGHQFVASRLAPLMVSWIDSLTKGAHR